MMKKYSLLYLLLLSTSLLFSQPMESLFKLGNQKYEVGEYSVALESYKQIEEQGYQSAELYFNMGNCHFKMGELAPSILYYERSLKLNPDDADVAFNLDIANKQTVDKIDQLPQTFLNRFWKSFSSIFSYDGWARAAVLMAWIFMLAFSAYYFMEQTTVRKVAFVCSLVALALCFLSVAVAYQQKAWEDGNKAAIVFAANSYVKSAPSASSEDIFILHEGTKVTVLENVAEWKRVKLSDGKTGWMPLSDLEEI